MIPLLTRRKANSNVHSVSTDRIVKFLAILAIAVILLSYEAAAVKCYTDSCKYYEGPPNGKGPKKDTSCFRPKTVKDCDKACVLVDITTENGGTLTSGLIRNCLSTGETGINVTKPNFCTTQIGNAADWWKLAFGDTITPKSATWCFCTFDRCGVPGQASAPTISIFAILLGVVLGIISLSSSLE